MFMHMHGVSKFLLLEDSPKTLFLFEQPDKLV